MGTWGSSRTCSQFRVAVSVALFDSQVTGPSCRSGFEALRFSVGVKPACSLGSSEKPLHTRGSKHILLAEDPLCCSMCHAFCGMPGMLRSCKVAPTAGFKGQNLMVEVWWYVAELQKITRPCGARSVRTLGDIGCEECLRPWPSAMEQY